MGGEKNCSLRNRYWKLPWNITYAYVLVELRSGSCNLKCVNTSNSSFSLIDILDSSNWYGLMENSEKIIDHKTKKEMETIVY